MFGRLLPSCRPGLRGTAALLIVGVTVLSLSLSAFVGIRESNQHLQQQNDARVADVAKSLALASELPLAVGDRNELNDLARQFIDRESGAFALVYDEGGRLLAKAETQAGLWQAHQKDPASNRFTVAKHKVTLINRQDSHGGLDIGGPNWGIDANDFGNLGIENDNSLATRQTSNTDVKQTTHIGHVIIGDNNNVLTQTQKDVTVRTASAALFTALTAVPLALIIFQFWVRRLNRLLLASDRVANGDWLTPVVDGKHDEIGRLAEGMEHMRQAVKKHHEELKALNDTLQHKVEERTQALNRSVALARGILDSAADGVITIDPKGLIGVFNPAAAKLFGVQGKQVEGQPFAKLLANGVSVATNGELCVPVDGRMVFLGQDAEVDALRPDGQTIPIQISLAPLQINGQQHLTAVIRDISERRRVEDEREQMVGQLLEASRHAGMAEVASSVLHNVGNVLNSINVSVQCVQTALNNKSLEQLNQAANILQEEKGDLEKFMREDPRGKHLPDFLSQLAKAMSGHRTQVHQELSSLSDHVEHVKRIIKTQQSYAKTVGVDEETNLKELVRDAIRINADGLKTHNVQVCEDLADFPNVQIDKHSVLQIVVNLVRNARNAMENIDGGKQLHVRLLPPSPGKQRFQIVVQDSGCGIPEENLTRIFNHGFTTRKEGNGYGLHSAAVAAQKMGGTLTATSEGPGLGACFVLDLPTHQESPSARLPAAA